jgi:hypothetical protein
VSRVLLIAAAFCFLIATLIATGATIIGTFDDWIAGGLLAFVLASLVPPAP